MPGASIRALLGQAQAHRRGAGHFGCECEPGLEQFVVVDDVADQPHGLGPIGLEKSPGQQQFGRHGKTDQPG